MLFWTAVFFITYSLVYFIVSQRKIKRLRNSNFALRSNLNEKNAMLQKAKSGKAHYHKEFAE